MSKIKLSPKLQKIADQQAKAHREIFFPKNKRKALKADRMLRELLLGMELTNRIKKDIEKNKRKNETL